jgi:hypothetical protein
VIIELMVISREEIISSSLKLIITVFIMHGFKFMHQENNINRE